MVQRVRTGITNQVASIAIALIAYAIVSGLVDSLIGLPWYVRTWDKVKHTVKEYGIGIAFLVLFAALIVRFAWWGNYPNIISASVFWALATTYGILFIITASNIFIRIGWIIMRVGGTLNMIVTLANGGFMPIVGAEAQGGIWVNATESHHLLLLADRFWTLSIGDFILIGGLAFLFLSSLINAIKRRLDAKHGDMSTLR